MIVKINPEIGFCHVFVEVIMIDNLKKKLLKVLRKNTQAKVAYANQLVSDRYSIQNIRSSALLD